MLQQKSTTNIVDIDINHTVTLKQIDNFVIHWQDIINL
jgi:hypothetical protein